MSDKRLPSNAGEVGILNVGDGDTKLSFDPRNPAERIRAARIVKDMIRRGYCLLIEIEKDGKKEFTRAIDFNETVCEYIIADFDPLIAQEHDKQESHHGNDTQSSGATPTGESSPAPKRQYRKRGVKAEGSRAVAVAPIAGG